MHASPRRSRALLILACLTALAPLEAKAQTVELVRAFEGRPFGPRAGLVEGSDGGLYGTSRGGASGYGSIYKVTPDGALTVVHAFGGEQIQPAAPLTRVGADLYGTTTLLLAALPSGAFTTRPGGSVFRLREDGRLDTLHVFTGPDGAAPFDGLTLGSDGALYGTTQSGGLYGAGTVFRVGLAGGLTTLHHFGAQAGDGRTPRGELTEGEPGVFYGVTQQGGAAGLGALFRATSSGRVEVLHSFAGTPEGRSPAGALYADPAGNLWGATAYGGTSDCGTVFRRDASSGALTTVHSFGCGSAGAYPFAGLVPGPDGRLWGTTAGASGVGGTVYSVGAGAPPSHQVHHVFGGDEIFPRGRLLLASDGALYGTVEGAGAVTWWGLVYRIRAGVYERVSPFTTGDMGFWPMSIAAADDGSLYGTTQLGGEHGRGTAFRVRADGAFQTVHAFEDLDIWGRPPSSTRVTWSRTDQVMYGARSGGGSRGGGALFSLTPEGSRTDLVSFGSASTDPDGNTPMAAPVEGTDGRLYGATAVGGANGWGTVYSAAKGGGDLQTIAAFDASLTHPWGRMLEASDGSIYGAAYLSQSAQSAPPSFGGFFSIGKGGDPPLRSVHRLTARSDGANPLSPLVELGPGRLYGIARGGAFDRGVVFELTKTGPSSHAYRVVHDFAGAPGDGYPNSWPDIVAGDDGFLYGVTGFGGAADKGTVFRVRPDGADYFVIHSFSGPDGWRPNALTKGADGDLYGVTNVGGPQGGGVVFRVRLPLMQVDAPGISPAGGVFQAPTSVTLTASTPESIVRYTTDGTDPTEASAVYTGPLAIAATTELRARAWRPGWLPSLTAAAVYRFTLGTLDPPVISPAPGAYETSVEVSIAGPAEADIRYTTDGTAPTTASPLYAGPFTLGASAAVRAASFQTDWTASAAAEAAYEVVVATPVLSPPGGSYRTPQDVSIASATPGAAITYTLDGSDPTEAGQTLAQGETVRVDGPATLRARAWKPGLTPSAVAEAVYASIPGPGRIAAGPEHLLYVDAQGTTWAWGQGDAGQLGDGGGRSSAHAVEVVLADVVEVAAGGRHSLARRADGTIWSWGDNSFGQGGRAAGGAWLVPSEITGLNGVKALAAGEGHSLALASDGQVWSWGAGASGQLGNGTNADSGTPAPVAGLSDVVQIAAGAHHSLALRADGSVWAFGAGAVGQLGTGGFEAGNRPAPVSLPSAASRIAAGDNHSMAIVADGGLYGWGEGRSGQLGSEASAPSNVPVPVADRFCGDEGPSVTPVAAVLADGGLDHSVGLVDSEWSELGVRSWGHEGWAPCESQASFSLVLNEEIADLSSAGNRNLALGNSGQLWYWEQTAKGPTAPVALSELDGTLRAFPPVFSLASGTYRSEQTVTITAPTPGSVVHYTTDGSWPDAESPVVASGATLPVTRSIELQAVALLPGRPASDVRRASYLLKVMDPVLGPPPSGYDGPLDVTLTVETNEASLRYSTSRWPKEDDPELPSGTRVALQPPAELYVRGYREGWEPSEASGVYRLAVVTPVLSPPGGDFTEPVEVMVTTTTPGVTLRYRTDGGAPTFFDPTIASGATIRIERSTTLAVNGWRADLGVSDTAWGSYRFALPAPTLHAERSGDETSPLYVTGATSVAQATVRCTTDGSEPTVVSRVCTRRFPVDATATVRARAFAYGWAPSAIAEETYAVAGDALETPVIGLPSGSYPAARHVSITCASPEATIHYTTNGADPTPDDPTIAPGGAFLLDRSLTLKARAWRESRASLVASADYALTGAVTLPRYHSTVVVLKTDGSVWGFGANDRGQVGQGDTSTPVSTPARAAIDDVVRIASGPGHTVALRRDGSVWTWGANDAGQLGTGQEADGFRATPAPLELDGVEWVAAGNSFSAALDGDGRLWTWGGAPWWQDPVPEHLVPQLRTDVRCARIFASGEQLACLDDEGEARIAYGPRTDFYPAPGALGLIDFVAGEALATHGGARGGVSIAAPLLASRIAADLYLGRRAVPWAVESLHGDSRSVVAEAAPAVALASSSIVKADGTLWRWGGNSNGELGEGAPSEGRAAPGPVPGFAVFTDTWLLEDPDADGLRNVEELDLGTDPYLADTNADGVPDGTAEGALVDAVSVDLDGDRLSNARESEIGTNPLVADSDADGVVDGADAFPLDPGRSAPPAPDPSDTTPPDIHLIEPANAVLVAPHP